MSICEKAKEEIKRDLYHLTEITRKHLEECSDCLHYYNTHAEIKDFLKTADLPKPSASLLNECRTRLHYNIINAKAKNREVFFERFFLSPKLRLAGILCVFVLGILTGGFLFNAKITGLFPVEQVNKKELYISNLSPTIPKIFNTKLVHYDPLKDEVELELDALSKVKLRGEVDEPLIKDILFHALLKDGRSGVRLKVIEILGKRKNDNNIKNTLIEALHNDPNPGVRLNSLKALRGMERDQEINKAFMKVLREEENSGIRIAAIESISDYIYGADLELIKEKAEHDDNYFIQMKAEEILSTIKGQKIEQIQ